MPVGNVPTTVGWLEFEMSRIRSCARPCAFSTTTARVPTTATLVPVNGTLALPSTVPPDGLDTSATDNPNGLEATKACPLTTTESYAVVPTPDTKPSKCGPADAGVSVGLGASVLVGVA